ncbi:MAG: glycosyltransferase 87 family protein, partial [Anaerolineae bacterium]
MVLPTDRLPRVVAREIRGWWADHRIVILRLTTILMAALALLKLGSEFYRLVLDPGPKGAIDLKLLHRVIIQWFAGKPVYDELGRGYHPPAAYAVLWPWMGWLTLSQTRWLWAASSVAALAVLACLVVEESGAAGLTERALAALMPLSLNATGVTLGNGQLTIHLVTLLLLAVWLQRRQPHAPGGWPVLSTVVAFTLVKPTVSLPFMWLIVLGPGGLRTALAAAVAYIGLTAFSTSFQGSGMVSLLGKWLAQGSALAVQGGYANLHIWAGALGFEQWLLPLSLVVLTALGAWVYAFRRRDPWLLLGVTALVARFWTYHRLYDDMLVLFPMVTLFQLAKRGPRDDGRDVAAGTLLGAVVLAMMIPARLRFAAWPWHLIFTAGHALIWAIVLLFLLCQTARGE